MYKYVEVIQSVLVNVPCALEKKCVLCYQTVDSVVQIFYILSLIYFLTGYNSFAMLYLFLLYNNMNQSYVYIYPFPCSPGPIPTSRSAQTTQLNSPALYSYFPQAICFTRGKCVYVFMPLSQFIPLLCPQIHSLPLHLYSCLANRFIGTVFLEFLYSY